MPDGSPPLVQYDAEAPTVACGLRSPPPVPEYWRPPVFAGVAESGELYVFDSLNTETRAMQQLPDGLQKLSAGGRLDLHEKDVALWLFVAGLGNYNGGGIAAHREGAGVVGPGETGTRVVLFEEGLTELPLGIGALSFGVDVEPGDCDALDDTPPATGAWNEIDYVAQIAGGEYIAVVALRLDHAGVSALGRHFVFFGTPDAVEQRELTGFRGLEGQGREFQFRVANETYVAAFPGSCDASNVSSKCPGSLTRGDSGRSEILTPAAEELADYDDLDELLQLRCRVRVSSR